MSFSDTLAKAVLSTSSDAIIAVDKEGIIRFWNPGAERIFGYASGAAIGQSLDIIIPERLRKRHWDGYRHVIKSGESRYGQGDILAVPGLKKDGAGAPSSSRLCRCEMEPASSPGSDHARRYQTLRGDARAEAKARGSDEGLMLMRRRARSQVSRMALPFFIIDEFVDLLSKAEVRLVVDVRTIPRSRTNPQYNSDVLAKSLSESRRPCGGDVIGDHRRLSDLIAAGETVFHILGRNHIEQAHMTGAAQLRPVGTAMMLPFQ